MKFMNMKRFGATVMAGALALSLSAPAFASNNTTNITGSYTPITLKVVVPQTGNAIINPYGLPVELDTDTVISGEQITTGAPLVIKNQSKVALAVKAKVTGTVKGDATFDASAIAAGETDKKMNVKFEAFPAPGVLDDTDAADLNAMFAALKTADAKLTATLSTTAADATGTLVLREGDEDGATQDGGAAFFRLSGTVAKAPTNAWAVADGFTAAVAFSFEPSEYVGSVTLKTAGDATTVDENGTLAVTVDLPTGVRAVANTIKWTSSKEANITVTPGTSSTTQLAATLNGVLASGTTSVKISVEFQGNDGITYRSNELSLKCV